MRVIAPVSAWLRSLLAVALVLAVMAPAPAASVPDWLAAAICQAPSTDTPDQPSHPGHDHCALCQTAQAVALPPLPVSLARPMLAFAAPSIAAPQAKLLPAPPRAYASRAPPRIG